MGTKYILGVSLEIPSDDVYKISFDSDYSLLEPDIILFRPDISDYTSSAQSYQGKPSLSLNTSSRLLNASSHWEREIIAAFDSGKTIIVFLSAYLEVFIDIGERETSGTGKNQKVTHKVVRYDNYRCLPFKATVTTASGFFMALDPSCLFLKGYWSEFEKHTRYSVYFDSEHLEPLLRTKNGDRVVGAFKRHPASGGVILYLPEVDFTEPQFVEETGYSGDVQKWTQKGEQAGKRFVKALVALDKDIRGELGASPMPEWLSNEEYDTSKECLIREKIAKTETQLEKKVAQRDKLMEQLHQEGRLKPLLYENGYPLESAIRHALEVLGFSAKAFNDGTSEFDVVFESREGRMIGEAEGKEKSAVNISKIRQLLTNIHEDFEQDQIDKMAKGVLFGNAHRFSPPAERGDYFTRKCLTAAEQYGFALVRTPDLFEVARHVEDSKDEKFAQQCREAIIAASGQIVAFPKLPVRI